MRRIVISLALLVVAALALVDCSSMNFIKRRLPPPTVTPNGVIFRFSSPSARVVQLAGNWPENNWLAGQAQSGTFRIGQMEDPSGSGVWTRTEKLPPGRYQYKFVVDGVTWKEDPNNPNRTNDGYGGNNSVLDVR